MSKKIFLVDVARCNGCHNCQIACKDEQEVHGSVPKVNMTYMPKIGAQTEAIREYAPEVLMGREDGLRFGDEADFADELANAEKLDPKVNMYYLNLPKKFVAGQVVDEAEGEVVIGATVTMQEEGNAGVRNRAPARVSSRSGYFFDPSRQGAKWNSAPTRVFQNWIPCRPN